jgi:heptosyltransferase III
MPAKLLAIMFKYLGDVVVATPTLRALHAKYPDWELHALVPEEAAPLLEGLPWMTRVWAFPRRRRSANLGASLPLLRELRAQQFELSIDFFGNDRGALTSRLIGARRRLGSVPERGAYMRSRCYTDPVEAFDTTRHESIRTWAVTAPLGVPFPEDMTMGIAPRPAHAEAAARALDADRVLCYVSASQPKRQWPLEHWAAFAQFARAGGVEIVFTSGNTPRERETLERLVERIPHAVVLPPPEPLDFMLAVLARARAFVTSDAGPLHFAAALGVPTLGLFGPTAATRWAPLGAKHRALQGGLCPCSGHDAACSAVRPCMGQIAPQDAWRACVGMLGIDAGVDAAA